MVEHTKIGDDLLCEGYQSSFEPSEIQDDGSCPLCGAQVEQ